MEILATIPSPGTSEIHLGPLPLRGYALCIIVGVFLAIWLGGRRWVDRGGRAGTVADIAVWAVPFGLVGARLYHVATDYQLYFGEGRNWVDAARIWDGGIGIWGAIVGGALGAWIGCRRRGIPLPAFADAVAPGIAFAQAIGRWGNWFNQELYGRPTDLPWAVEIDNGLDIGTFHPTFLYESLWCLVVGILVIWADRRFRLGHGRAFALYVAAYTVGRFWVEYLRIDEAHEIFGLRLNNWTAIAVFLIAVVCLVISARRHPGREETVEPGAHDVAADAADPDATDPKDADADVADGATADDAGNDGSDDVVGDPGDKDDGTDGTAADPASAAGGESAAVEGDEPDQPAGSVTEKPAEQVAEQAEEKPAEQVDGEPAERAAEQAGEEPVGKTVGKTAEKS